MGNTRKFDDIVDEAAVKRQIDQLIKELDRAKQAILSMPKVYSDVKENKSSYAQLAKEIEELKQQQIAMLKMTEQLNKENQKRVQLESDYALQLEKTRLQNEQKKKQIKEEAKDALGLNDAYSKLNKQYQEAARNAKNLGAQFGVNSKQYKEAAHHANELSEKLKAIDKGTGDMHRNVGNYAESIKEAFEHIAPEVEEATSKISMIGGLITKLGPAFGIAGGVIGAVMAPLLAFWKGTEEGIERLEVRISGLGGAFGYLTGQLGKLGKSIDDALGGEEANTLGNFWFSFFGFFGDKAQEMGRHMDVAAWKARQLTLLNQEMERTEIKMIPLRAEATEGLRKARLEATDANKTLAEKVILYDQVLEKENQQAEKEIEVAKEKVKLAEGAINLAKYQGKYLKDNLKLDKALADAQANVFNMQAESEARQTKAAKQKESFLREINQEEIALRIANLKDEEEHVLDKNRKIIASEKSVLGAKLTALRENLTESLRVKEEETKAKLNVPGMDETKRNEILKLAQTERFKLISEEAEAERKLLEESWKRQVNAEADIKKTRVQVKRDEVTETLNFDRVLYESELDYKKRIALAQKYTNLSLQDEQDQYDKFLILSEGKTHEELQAAEEEHNRKMVLITTNGELELINIHKEFYRKSLEDLGHDQTHKQTSSLAEYNGELEKLYNKLDKGKITVGQFNKEKEKLDFDSSMKGLQSQKKTLMEQYDKAYAEGDVKTYEALDAQILAIDNQMTQKKIDNKKRLKDEDVKYYQEVGELAQRSAELVMTIQNRRLEKEKNENAEKLNLIEDQKQADIQRITESTLSEQDKAAQIAIINANAASEKERIAKRQKELDQEKAKNDKILAIFNAIIGTAVSVASAKTPQEKIINGVLGAIALATIIATPVPKYAKGTDSAKEGWALTDEKGPEGYLTPSGDFFVGSNGPNLKYLEAGTKVIPHDQMNDLMNRAMIRNMSFEPKERMDMTADKLDKVVQMLAWQTSEYKKAMKGQKRPLVVNVHNNLSYLDHLNKQIFH